MDGSIKKPAYEGGMMKFVTRCIQCGDQNQLGDEDNELSIKLYFKRGSPVTFNRMVIYCQNCGNQYELGISWLFDTGAHIDD
jgi:hypothetical protein